MGKARSDFLGRSLASLGVDLEESARRCGALRRKRGFQSAEDLLRALLAYACADLSLRAVAAQWGLRCECLYRRFLGCERWLLELLGAALALEPRQTAGAGLRLLVSDATVVCGPGATGPQWRVHALYDPPAGRLAGLELTDERGPESLGRLPCGPGDLLLGDRGLGYPRSFLAALDSGAHVLVRTEPRSIRLLDERGERLDLGRWAQEAQEGAPLERDALLPGPGGRLEPVRVVAGRTPKGVWVLTTSLSREQASAAELLGLYRLRWQVELEFKRLKSLSCLGGLPCAKGPMARVWVLARLLAAALAEREASPARPTLGGGRARGAASGGSSRPRSGPCGCAL